MSGDPYNTQLEYCPKCRAHVPSLKRHTCALRLGSPAIMPFSAEQEQRFREIARQVVQEEMRRQVK